MNVVRHTVCPAGTCSGTPTGRHVETCWVQNQNQTVVTPGLWSWVAEVRTHASDRNVREDHPAPLTARRGQGDACNRFAKGLIPCP